jgi:hypothetical protein
MIGATHEGLSVRRVVRVRMMLLLVRMRTYRRCLLMLLLLLHVVLMHQRRRRLQVVSRRRHIAVGAAGTVPVVELHHGAGERRIGFVLRLEVAFAVVAASTVVAAVAVVIVVIRAVQMARRFSETATRQTVHTIYRTGDNLSLLFRRA